MSIVSIKKVEEYDLDLVYQKMEECINLLGGIEKFVKKDSKVFIKLNCIGPFDKDMQITTHPIFFEACVKLVLKMTNNITVGDNPGSKDIMVCLKKNGCLDVINKYNLKIFNGLDKKVIHNSNYKVYSSFEISKEYVECDTLINLPKLKTHTLTYMTGSEKNYFGLIYGYEKASWHTKASNPLQFSIAISDLYGALLEEMKDKTILNICDGIIGLDGDGPSTGGYPHKVGAILASTDAISLDTVMCKLVKLDLNKLIITNTSSSFNLGDNKNIEIVGNTLLDFDSVKFNGPKSQLSSIGLRLIRKKIFRNLLLQHPVINEKICLKCGECAKICPAKTMKIKPGSFPSLNTKDCIRCWCCQEVCPRNAIEKSRKPLLGKIVIK